MIVIVPPLTGRPEFHEEAIEARAFTIEAPEHEDE
jgi:hypothetical protein